MIRNGKPLTPALSLLCGPQEYCYWDGKDETKPPPDAGFVFKTKAGFAEAVYADYPQGLPKPVIVGSPYRVGPGTVIGGDGFGWYQNGQSWKRFPHIGGVIIEPMVEIGSNVTIDRGAIGMTVIGHGVKIDNGVHVGHNAKIGANTLLTAHCVIGGSAIIGDDSWIGLGAQIRNKVEIGAGVTVGMGAIVVKDVAPGLTVIGNPAKQMATVR